MDNFSPSMVRCCHTFFLMEQPQDTLTDLFCLHSINNGVHHGRQKKVKIGHNDVNMRSDVMTTKMVCKEGEEGWCIRDSNGTEMSSAGAKCLAPLFWRGKAHNCLQDHEVRHCNAGDIKAPNQHGNCQAIYSINSDIAASQLYHCHMVTIGVSNSSALAIYHFPDQKRKGEDENCSSEEGEDPYLKNDWVGQDSSIS